MVKESEKRLRARYKHVAADVEFALVDKQRIRNVLLNDPAERFNYAPLLLAVVGELQLLFEHVGTADQIDAAALVQRDGLANPELVIFGRLKERLPVDPIVELVRQRHILFERHETGRSVGILQLQLLVRLQAAQQVELVGEQMAIGYVIDQLIALLESVPVDGTRRLNPPEFVRVVVALIDLLPVESFHNVNDSTIKTTNEPYENQI